MRFSSGTESRQIEHYSFPSVSWMTKCQTPHGFHIPILECLQGAWHRLCDGEGTGPCPLGVYSLNSACVALLCANRGSLSSRTRQCWDQAGFVLFLLVWLYQNGIVPVPGPSGAGCLSLVMAGHIKFKNQLLIKIVLRPNEMNLGLCFEVQVEILFCEQGLMASLSGASQTRRADSSGVFPAGAMIE